MIQRAVFLDRDGTINVDTGYVHTVEEFEFLPQAIEAIKLLNDNGFLVIVVTNQAGVARGYYTEADVIELHQFINRELQKQGAYIDAFYICPHHPTEGIGEYRKSCECRKPGSQMVVDAGKDFNVDLHASWIIGDKISDIFAGAQVGCTGILITNQRDERIDVDYLVCSSLFEGVNIIINKQ